MESETNVQILVLRGVGHSSALLCESDRDLAAELQRAWAMHRASVAIWDLVSPTRPLTSLGRVAGSKLESMLESRPMFTISAFIGKLASLF